MTKNREYEIIAAVMKKYRVRNKIKATTMHERMGLPTRQAFYGYESGKQPISMAIFIRWCDALGIKLRSAAEAIEEARTGVKRDRRSKKEQARRAAKALLAQEAAK